MIVNDKKVALIGDKISCPKEGHGINAIIEGSSALTMFRQSSLPIPDYDYDYDKYGVGL